MIPWYIADAGRYAGEIEGLRVLDAAAAWLTIEQARLDEAHRVCIDFAIAARGASFEATLRYPQAFPFTPPSVLPRGSERWSDHQYSTGELCLEYGPDNWRPELTGAEMVASAERLLAGEAADPAGVQGEVVSRHHLTTGQELRSEWGRFLITPALDEHIESLPRGETVKATFFGLSREETYVIVARTVSRAGGEPWADPGVPPLGRFAASWEGLGFGLPPGATLPRLPSTAQLRAALTDLGHAVPEGFEAAGIELLLVWGDAGVQLFWLRADEVKAFVLAPVRSMGGQRLDADHARLASKTVGVVGCGSIGSKLATSLARAGVRHFVLVDDDVFLPENLVRHDLDWLSMGEHKAEALARRLALAAPGTESVVRRLRLGGQEAAGGADWALTQLRDCYLVVDATADPGVFNLLAGLVATAEKPLVWAEVFGGGIGGLIARSRPGLDPPPQGVRGRIDGWCAERGVTAPRPIPGYGADGADNPLIADDADVGAIAAHAARFALDILIGRSPSAFPASAYLIGLREAWVFREPFHTIPLDVGPTEPKAPPAPPRPEAIAAVLQLFTRPG